MNEQQNAIKIARVEAHIEGLREQQKSHHESNTKRFDSMEDKIDGLVAIMNRGKGAYTASMVLAAALGAFLLTLMKTVAAFFR